MIFKFKKYGLTIWESWFTVPTYWFFYGLIPSSFRNIYQLQSSPMFRLFFHKTTTMTLLTDLTLTIEDIRKSLSSTLRNEIRREAGFTFSVSNTSDSLIEFYDAFALAKGLQKITGRIEKYPPDSLIWTLVKKDTELLAVHAYILTKDTVRLLYSGTQLSPPSESTANRNLIALANKQLHWHDLNFFKLKGHSNLDWGGIDEARLPGISNFKKSFGGKAVVILNYNSWIMYLLNILLELKLRLAKIAS